MVSTVCSVYSFFSSPMTGFSSIFLLGAPSLERYVFKGKYDQKWKWPAAILTLGATSLCIDKDKKIPMGKSCLISLVLSSVGHAIARYATKNKFVGSQALHENISLIESDSKKGSGVLAKDEKLGYILVTAKHVVSSKTVAYIQGAPISLDRLKSYESGSDILLFALPDVFGDESRSIPTVLVNAQLQLGEKVYFGGYPFKETEARLHLGHVSHVGTNGRISIDGTAVPGMSGGPIAVLRRGKFYIVGVIASETFDPIKGFTNALGEMYLAQHAKEREDQMLDECMESMREDFQSQTGPKPQKIIRREELRISNLDSLVLSDPDIFGKIWDNLNEGGVISSDGFVDPEKIRSRQLGLREEFQTYENDIIESLKARPPSIDQYGSSQVSWPFKVGKPIDSVNTVGLSLAQSLSTGLITAHLLQEYREVGSDTTHQESTELEIGKGNRLAKNKQRTEKEAHRLRAEAKQSGCFVNTGAPSVLYRFVSKEDAKTIKRDGIVHTGEELDEIPFLTKPLKKMALSVGAVSTDKLVCVFTDKIPQLAQENVGKVSERNGVITYRINRSIPNDAIEVSEA